MTGYVDIVIDGKVYSIEHSDDDYAGRLSAYLNNKYEGLSEVEGFNRRSSDYRNMMVQINVADDYLKCKDENRRLKEIIDEYERQIYKLKHELITIRLKNKDKDKDD